MHRLCLLSHYSTDCFLFLCSLCRSLAVAASFLEIVFPYLVSIIASSRAQLFELCWVMQRGDQPIWRYPHPCKGFGCGEKKWSVPAFSDLGTELPDFIHCILNFILFNSEAKAHSSLCFCFFAFVIWTWPSFCPLRPTPPASLQSWRSLSAFFHLSSAQEYS